MQITKKPAEIDLFGINPRWVEAENNNFASTIRCEIFEKDNAGIYQPIVTLSNHYDIETGTAVFNISQFIQFSYDLPSAASIDFFASKLLVNNWKEYQVNLKDYGFTNTLISEDSFEALAIKGGRELHLSRSFDFMAEWVTQRKFLSLQPRSKKVAPHQPEWLSYIIHHDNAQNLRHVVKAHLYFSDGTEDIVSVLPSGDALQLHSFSARNKEIVCFSAGFTQTNLQRHETADKFILSYDLWVDSHEPPPSNVQGTSLGAFLFSSEKMTYRLDYDLQSWPNRFFLFQNNIGGLDTLRAMGKQETSKKHNRETQSIYERPGYEVHQHSVKINRTSANTVNKINLGWLEPAELDWIEDIGHATYVWLIDVEEKAFIPVQITSTNLAAGKDDEPLQTATITYETTNRQAR